MTGFHVPARHARLLAYARSLTPPSGWKIEVSGDEIVMTAGPAPVRLRPRHR